MNTNKYRELEKENDELKTLLKKRGEDHIKEHLTENDELRANVEKCLKELSEVNKDKCSALDENTSLKLDCSHSEAELATATARISRLEEALKFYANEWNSDGGTVAKQALEMVGSE